MPTSYKLVKKQLSKDPVMKQLVGEVDELQWGRSRDPFEDLVYSIISQQLSDKAASTIYERFRKLLGRKKLNSKNLLDLDNEEIRGSGISYSKASYLKNLSIAVINKDLELGKLNTMDNDEIIEKLVEIKGIGRWTAEMFLMFTLEREDVFSLGDLGLRTAVSKFYGVERSDLKKIEEISLKWKPYRTWASRYLWRSLDT